MGVSYRWIKNGDGAYMYVSIVYTTTRHHSQNLWQIVSLPLAV